MNTPATVPQPEVLLEREAAIAGVRAAVAASRNLLVHGPAGVGKSALLRAALAGPSPRPLFCSAATAAGMYRQALAAAGGSGESPAALTSARCRHRLEAAMAAAPCCLVWDPAPAASRTVANQVRDLLRRCAVPLVCAARSPHMDDLGFLATLFALQSERLPLAPLSPAGARQLAACEMARLQVAFDDPRVLPELLRLAQGRPGEIRAMLALARLPRYRHGGQVKLHLIYLDRLSAPTSPEHGYA